MTTKYEANSNYGGTYAQILGNAWQSESFKSSVFFALSELKLPLTKNGTPNTVDVRIYNALATGEPVFDDDNLLASETLDGNSLPAFASPAFATITLTTPILIKPGADYAILVRPSNDYVCWHYGDAYANGYRWSYVPGISPWTLEANDASFEAWGGVDYAVHIDWDGDGDFSETSEDVTTSVKSVRWRRGKDREWGTAQSGSCEVLLADTNGTYNPITNPDVRPKRKMQVSVGGAPLFTGWIEEINPHPGQNDLECYVSAIDGMDYLSRAQIQIGTEDASNDEDAVTLMLDTISWPDADRLIDSSSAHDMPVLSFDGSVKSGLDKVAKAYFGFWWIDGMGRIRYETRQHRPLHTSRGTFTDPVATYSINARNVFNRAQVRWYTKVISASSATTVDVDWPCNAVLLAPDTEVFVNVSSGSYAMAGSPTGITVVAHNPDESVYTGPIGPTGLEYVVWSISKPIITLRFYNNGLQTLHLNHVEMTSLYYTLKQSGMEDSQDDASILAYQERVSALDNDFVSELLAAQISPATVTALKDPRGELTITLTAVNDADKYLLNSLEISDLVTLVYNRLGIDGDFYVDHLDHTISDGGLIHTVTYRLVESGVVLLVGLTFPLTFPLTFEYLP
jgi:hypothetical protein